MCLLSLCGALRALPVLLQAAGVRSNAALGVGGSVLALLVGMANHVVVLMLFLLPVLLNRLLAVLVARSAHKTAQGAHSGTGCVCELPPTNCKKRAQHKDE